MARFWKIVRHGASGQWEDSIPKDSLAEGQLVVLLGRLAASHLPPVATPLPRNAPRYTTSLTVKNDRFGNKRFIVYASGSRVHYIATLEETPRMPKGPKGEKRPADVIGNAIKIARIATGEEEETLTSEGKDAAAVSLGSRGGRARAEKLSDAQRKKIAKKAAKVRWSRQKEEAG
ncbi:hypothetical protein [Hyphomicrobium sp. 2TAF46]|uniref:hypothetical protein n=1 Tax=Hyphomicrobium sp. 2TAF46 TaxID=3233019 RepID=UPI003F9363B1